MAKITTWIAANKLTAGLIALIVLIAVIGGLFFKNSLAKKNAAPVDVPEVDLPFDPSGPYALLFPRDDGNALILNIKRVASYDSISYELAYTSEGIDRGVVGNLDTKQKKGEYEQEILFGTCSKNVCKYDTGVENGTLTLHIKNAGQAFKMLIQWHLQKPDVALGVLNSADGHFNYKIDKNDPGLAQVNYTIINELSGVPKLPDNMTVVGKVYALNTPIAKIVPTGVISVELADKPTDKMSIYRYDESQNQWTKLDTKISSSTLVATSDKGGIFAVLASK